MPYALIICSAQTGTVYHYQFYTPEGNDIHRKARLREIVSVVCSEYRFRVECSTSNNRHRQHAATTMSGRPIGQQNRDELITTATPASVLRAVETGNNASMSSTTHRRNHNRSNNSPVSSNNSTTNINSNTNTNTNTNSNTPFRTKARKGQNGIESDSSSSFLSPFASRSRNNKNTTTTSNAFSCEPPTEKMGMMSGLFSSLRNAWIPSPSTGSMPPRQSSPTAMEQAASDAARGRGLAASEGIIRLPRNELLECSKLIVWRQVLSSAFVLVCDSDDNLVLASNFLSIFISLLSEKMNSSIVASTPELFLQQPEIVMELTAKLLPCGQLIYTNPSMAQYIASPHFQANSYDMAESSDVVFDGN